MVKAQLILTAAALATTNAFSFQTPSNVSRIESRWVAAAEAQNSLTVMLCPWYQEAATSARRDFLKTTAATTAAAVFSAPTIASAAVEVPEQITAYDFPSNWGLTYKYDEDASKVREHMYLATTLGKGADRMEDYGKNMKKEMVDFVSYYRRFPKIAGKPSFSTLYTAINVLAGHYTSYGYKYPLPEKRRKRLFQEYAEIAKSLKRGR